MIDLSGTQKSEIRNQKMEAEEIAMAVVAVILWSVILLGWMGVWG